VKKEKKQYQHPPQTQKKQPGREFKMHPKPKFLDPDYEGSNKLKGKIAIITGGDSGIGRAVAIAFAIEGANIVISYLNEHTDARETKKIIESKGRECLLLSGDISKSAFCKKIVTKTIQKFKKIDVLVNNSAEQHPQDHLTDITDKQLEKTFRTNIFSYFYLTKAAIPHLKKNAVIINTTSVTAYKGSDHLIDYAATKGAIVAFTRSLSENIIHKGIRVNAVAPGPIWTPLIPASFSRNEVKKFGSKTPMNRSGEPKEISPCYVFLASDDSSYMSGQVLHPNGGVIVNG
jgi:NAD(P)-dependent dehydrogenase (short-subunit alcohol dehydrogenase family)